VADGYNLHRLFSIGEAARYECTIDAARNVVAPGETLISEKRSLKATFRLKTTTIREGVAMQVLSVIAAEETDQAKPTKAWELDRAPARADGGAGR